MSDNIKEISQDDKLQLEFAQQLSELMKFNQEQILTTQRVTGHIRKYAQYTQKQIEDFLENPKENARQLRQVSRYLYDTNNMYREVCNYHADINLYSSVLVPTKKATKKDYEKATDYLNVLNLQFCLYDAYATVFKEGIYYGISVESDNAHCLYKLDPDYCRISSIEFNGKVNFEFDLAFFRTNMKTWDCKVTMLENFDSMIPNFFKSKFNDYKNGGDRWVELPTDKSLCLKMGSDLEVSIPPFLGSSYKDLDDVNDYKVLAKVKTEQNSYKLLSMNIPLQPNNKNEKADNFAVKLGTAQQFYGLTRSNLDPSIGLILSPRPVEAISFSDSASSTDTNRVETSTEQFYNSVGIPQAIFNNSSVTALKYAISRIDAKLNTLNRQVEVWATQKLSQKIKGNKFKLKMLDVTKNNANDDIDKLMKLAQYGVPSTTLVSSLAGMNQSDLEWLNYVENDILDIANKFIPLSSSHTQSANGNESVGRPRSNDEDLSESGAVTRENGSNLDRGGNV